MTDSRENAQRFAELFASVYLTFHRRDGARNELSGSSRAVLMHLATVGPVTIGEAAAHLNRAQSVVSEIVGGLERTGLLERETDPADRRRTLVWLTPLGHDRLRADQSVLSRDQLAATLQRLPQPQIESLLSGLRALVRSAVPPASVTEMQGDKDDIHTEL